MVRFCDKEVYGAKISQITRRKLITHFCQKGHSLDIVMVYDEAGQWKGFISYDQILLNSSGEPEEFTDGSYVVAGEHLIWDAKEFFSQNPEKIWLVVCNEKREPQCFAYNDTQRSTVYEERNQALDVLEKYTELLGIEELYPRVQAVCIHGCNEWAYRWQRILKKRGMPVRLMGEKWNLIYKEPHVNNQEEYPEYAVMNIYAEGTEYLTQIQQKDSYRFNDVGGAFVFLRHLMILNCRKKVELFQKELGKQVLVCRIPAFKELKDFTAEEYFRHDNIIPEDSNIKSRLAYRELGKVYGMPSEEFVTQKKEEEERGRKMLGDLRVIAAKEAVHTVYLIGPCITLGMGVFFEDMLMYQIQELLEDGKLDYAVKAVTCSETDYEHLEHILNTIPVTSKDIVLFMERGQDDEVEGCGIEGAGLDLTDLFNSRPIDAPWFFDCPIHTNAAGNRAVAKEIVDKFLRPSIQQAQKEEEYNVLAGNLLPEEYRHRLKVYLETIQEQTKEIPDTATIGAIIMNCNPFTLGHQYLIEWAAGQVDYLYIFVVQEDRSVFPFEDRMKLVQAGIKQYENVRVFPSGEFILSYHTMPSYFQKEELQNVQIDASGDVELFSRYIAPVLGISVRFVGEEPLDRVTDQYNRAMEKILGRHGIDFVEIPRKETQGRPISASLVRKLLEEQAWDGISRLVPETTLAYLKQRSI